MKNLGFIVAAFVFITTGCVSNGDDEFIEGSGTIEATNIIISSKTAGTVLSILYEEGSMVRRGDTVLVVDHELLDIQLDQARAAMDMAEAGFNLASKGARSEDVAQAKEAYNQAEANYGLAFEDKDRMKKLFDSGSITKKQWDEALARFTVSKSRLNAASENYQKIQTIIRPDELTQARANFEKAQASVRLIEKNIRDCYFTAPTDGFVVETFFEEGESVRPGSSLFKVSDQRVVDLVIYVPEAKLGWVKLGQRAEVKIDAFPEKTFEGKVSYISPEAEFTPKNIQTKDERTKLVFAVKIEIPNENFELKAGLPADGKIYMDLVF